MRKGAKILAMISLAFTVSCTPDGLIEGPSASGGTYLAVLRGHAYAVGGGDVSGLSAMWRPAGGTVVDSAQVAADGSFSIQTTTADRSGTLVIDGPEPRRFEPFEYPLGEAELLNADVVLIPREWTTMTPQDSADIWGVLDRMEEIFGPDLSQPATADSSWWPGAVTYTRSDLIPGVIRLVFGGPGVAWRGAPLSGDQGLQWNQDLGSWAAQSRLTKVTVRHTRLNGGDLTIRRPLDSVFLGDGKQPWQTVLMSEMLHVLGVGHTLRIPSTQGPHMRTQEVSPYDVAYIELLRETIMTEEEHDTFLGMMPAVIGERVILLGLPPVPDMDGARWS
jgi:hypothetical protein